MACITALTLSITIRLFNTPYSSLGPSALYIWPLQHHLSIQAAAVPLRDPLSREKTPLISPISTCTATVRVG